MDMLRRSAALIAAYAVALQLVLSAFAAVVPFMLGAEAGFALCGGDNPGTPAQPVAHDPCSACPAHCAAAAAGPDRETVAVRWLEAALAATSSSNAALDTTPHARGHFARAPPLA